MFKNKKFKRSILKNKFGFSLMELMIALGILVSVITVLASRSFGQRSKAKFSQAKIMISSLSNAVNMFSSECRYVPSTEEGFNVLLQETEKCVNWGPEPYIKKIPVDPWGTPYEYRYDSNSNTFEIISFGKDKKPGGEGANKDISSNDL